jgi:potassium-transporting ATPase KdpC subunit
MKDQIRMTILSLLLFTLILGIIYPLTICIVGQTFFPNHSHGGILKDSSERIIGSKFIGQNFSSAHYFHPRPSYAGTTGYDGMASGGSNLGPTSKKLFDLLQERIETYRLENNLTPTEPIPADAVTSSGSGLDPHISLQNAYLQAHRVATSRHIPLSTLRDLVRKETSKRWLGLFGEKHVNVLLLNHKIDQMFPGTITKEFEKSAFELGQGP